MLRHVLIFLKRNLLMTQEKKQPVMLVMQVPDIRDKMQTILNLFVDGLMTLIREED